VGDKPPLSVEMTFDRVNFHTQDLLTGLEKTSNQE
jgi:hypothetical protein